MRVAADGLGRDSRRRRVAWLSYFAVLLLGMSGLAVYCYRNAMRVDAELAPTFTTHGDQHGAHGYGAESARVDSQITLRIPAEQTEAVYAYLKEHYVDRGAVLKDRFPELNLHFKPKSDVSVFTDEYFDTPMLDLYRGRNSARHRTRINTTDPNDRKSGRELVQMKLTPPGAFTLRNELKYKVETRRTTPKKAKNMDDLSPLVRFVDRALREDFKKVFGEAGVNPYALKHVFTITQTRRRGYLDWDATNILSFSVDDGSASMLWARGRFASVDLGLVEIAYTEADEARRKTMWQIRDAIVDDLKQHFPDLVQTTNSKYGIVMGELIERCPLVPARVYLM